jgi:hypothetical protein
MNCAVEMGSGAMVYIPSYMKIGAAIQNLIVGDTQTHGHADRDGDRINLLFFLQNEESRLKIV